MIDRARACGLWALGIAFSAACGASPGIQESADGTSLDLDASTSTTDAPTTGAVDPPQPTACAEPTTVTAAPRTITEAVALINALPRPLALDCFLERLERPLAIAATSSIVSLQPAAGAHSPRVFLFTGEFVMSITVGGDHGFDLLEFGEPVGMHRSIKGEIAFPLDAELVTAEAPFTRILESSGGTKCGICHRGEATTPVYPQAYVSDALRHRDEDAVTLAALRGEFDRCDPSAQPERCARLTALFGHGPVEAAAFPVEMPTIYDYE